MNLTPLARWHGNRLKDFGSMPNTTASRVALRLHPRPCANKAGLFRGIPQSRIGSSSCRVTKNPARFWPGVGLRKQGTRFGAETPANTQTRLTKRSCETQPRLFLSAWCKGIPGFGPGGSGAIPGADTLFGYRTSVPWPVACPGVYLCLPRAPFMRRIRSLQRAWHCVTSYLRPLGPSHNSVSIIAGA